MIIQRHSFTYITLVLFVFALYQNHMLFGDAGVSHETVLASDSHAVKAGITPDGILSISAVSAAPNVPPNMKFGNHSRTLRAFIAPVRRFGEFHCFTRISNTVVA